MNYRYGFYRKFSFKNVLNKLRLHNCHFSSKDGAVVHLSKLQDDNVNSQTSDLISLREYSVYVCGTLTNNNIKEKELRTNRKSVVFLGIWAFIYSQQSNLWLNG